MLSGNGCEQLLKEVDDLSEILTELRIVLIHRMIEGTDPLNAEGTERRSSQEKRPLCDADDEFWYL